MHVWERVCYLFSVIFTVSTTGTDKVNCEHFPMTTTVKMLFSSSAVSNTELWKYIQQVLQETMLT